MRTLFIFLILSFSMLLNAQIQLTNTSGMNYTLNSYDIQKDQVKFTCVDNTEMSLSKKEVVYIKKSEDQLITFRSGKKKVVLKEENINPTDLATQGRIDAFRFYKTENKPTITDTKYLDSYNKQVKKIKSSTTVAWVCGGAAFVIGLTSFIATMQDVNSLP